MLKVVSAPVVSVATQALDVPASTRLAADLAPPDAGSRLLAIVEMDAGRPVPLYLSLGNLRN